MALPFSRCRLPSERQRSARRDHVHLVERRLRVGAAAIGIAGAKPPGRDRAGGAAGRGGELAGAAGDFPGLLHRHSEQAVARVEGERGDLPARADEVHGVLREDQIVPEDVGGVGGQVRDLDDPADAGEHPLGDDHAADDRAGARNARGLDGAGQRLGPARRRGRGHGWHRGDSQCGPGGQQRAC